ncbi:hypothetical protein KR009_009633, partial [Drosophila setifemur]
MDLSKAERQVSNEGHRSYAMRTLVQDLLCFFVLLSVALLIVAGILFVVEDVTRFQPERRLIHTGHIAHDPQAAGDETPSAIRRCFHPHSWIRFFNCQKKPDGAQEQGKGAELTQGQEQQQLQEQRPAEAHRDPTYKPEIGPRRQQASDNQIDTEPDAYHKNQHQDHVHRLEQLKEF